MDDPSSSLRSLYRLFLRASSASVLHHNAARKRLRRLFRPIFDAAAQAMGELRDSRLSRSDRIRRVLFLNSFQQRMDGTLSFLLNSAQYRGVPHRIIYNINQLRKAHVIWVYGRYYSGPKNAWNPTVVVTDNSKPRASRLQQAIDRMERNRVHEQCWATLGEVVKMAEGRHNLVLGRICLQPWTLEKR